MEILDRRPVAAADLQLDRLIDVVSVVYGGVIAYAFLLLMETAGDVLRHHVPLVGEPEPLVALALLAFVTNYMLADFIEARVFTHAVPYRGRARLTIDLLIAMFFLGAVQAANMGSRLVLLALGVTFVLGAVWATFLLHDGKDRYVWSYPGCVIATHIVAGLLLFVAYVGAPEPLVAGYVYWLWGAYFVWVAVVGGIKALFKVPESGFDLMPVSVFEFAGKRLFQLCQGYYHRIAG